MTLNLNLLAFCLFLTFFSVYSDEPFYIWFQGNATEISSTKALTGDDNAAIVQESWPHVAESEAWSHITVILQLEEAGASAEPDSIFTSLLIHCSYLENWLICFLRK